MGGSHQGLAVIFRALGPQPSFFQGIHLDPCVWCSLHSHLDERDHKITSKMGGIKLDAKIYGIFFLQFLIYLVHCLGWC